METGYLLVEIDPEQPDLVRLRRTGEAPLPPPPLLRYAARFEDVEAAQMHAHEGLRRRLVDVNQRLYRSSIATAVAVADAIELPHRRVYMDPALAADPALDAAIDRLHGRHRRWQRVFDGIGIAAAILLLAGAVLGI